MSENNNYDMTILDLSGSVRVEDCKMVEDESNWLQQEVVIREKRARPISNEFLDEDGFTTVRSKRSAKVSKMSNNVVLSSGRNEEENLPSSEEQIIVSITGKEVLPKPFKMAKLLREEGILNIINIHYKSPFKIIIEFENIESAQKLIECKKIIDMGFRCQLLNEMNFLYGIIRHVDLDILDEEIKVNLESDFEIVSLKRLNRVTSTGKWVESETIRIGFKGSVLPPYVRGYGCRFKVEPYMYPVTQCTGCWKFGHSNRFCPNRKIVCPKCTGYHPNCEISSYKCVNCKGNHMAIDKSCPVFLKEKNIRIIMRDMNYSYKKAFTIYLSENIPKKTNYQMKENSTRTEPEAENNKSAKTYKDVLMSQTDSVTNEQESSDEELHQEEGITGTKQRVKRSKKIKKHNKNRPKHDKNNVEENDTGKKTSDKKKGSGINFKKYIQKIKDIFMSDCNLEVKIKSFISFIIEETMKFISSLVGSNDICSWLLSSFNYE